MDQLPASISRSVSSLQSFLEHYSTGGLPPRPTLQRGSDDSVKRTSSGHVGVHHPPGSENDDTAYLSDEDDCYYDAATVSTNTRETSLQRSTIVSSVKKTATTVIKPISCDKEQSSDPCSQKDLSAIKPEPDTVDDFGLSRHLDTGSIFQRDLLATVQQSDWIRQISRTISSSSLGLPSCSDMVAEINEPPLISASSGHATHSRSQTLPMHSAIPTSMPDMTRTKSNISTLSQATICSETELSKEWQQPGLPDLSEQSCFPSSLTMKRSQSSHTTPALNVSHSRPTSSKLSGIDFPADQQSVSTTVSGSNFPPTPLAYRSQYSYFSTASNQSSTSNKSYSSRQSKNDLNRLSSSSPPLPPPSPLSFRSLRSSPSLSGTNGIDPDLKRSSFNQSSTINDDSMPATPPQRHYCQPHINSSRISPSSVPHASIPKSPSSTSNHSWLANSPKRAFATPSKSCTIIRKISGLPQLNSLGSFIQRAAIDLPSSNDEESQQLEEAWKEIVFENMGSFQEETGSNVFRLPPKRHLDIQAPDDEEDDQNTDDEDTQDDDETDTDDDSTVSIPMPRTLSFSINMCRGRSVDDALLGNKNEIMASYDISSIDEDNIMCREDGLDNPLSADISNLAQCSIQDAIFLVETELKHHAPPTQRGTTHQLTVSSISKDDDFKNRRNKTSKNQSSTKKQKKRAMVDVQHCRCFGHGSLWTTVALSFSWIGIFFAFLSRRSTHFVNLQQPLEISPLYEEVTEVGMVWMNLCFNETQLAYDDSYHGCSVIQLSSDDIDDRLFELSRSFLSLSVLFGAFLSIVLSTAIFWESINLKPIGFGLLLTYFFQSFALLFFDTKLCGRYGCKMSTGGFFCIIASFCWIVACIATAKMDSFKIRARQQRRREKRRKARIARREAKMRIKESLGDLATEPCSDSGSERNVEVELESTNNIVIRHC